MRPDPGTYALLLRAGSAVPVPVGKLGVLDLQPGFYLYLGSALGPGGLRARLAHHRRVAARPHWHLDYVRPHLRLEHLWYLFSLEHLECRWAAAVARTEDASVPLAGFGASDCRCRTHLFFFASPPARKTLQDRLRAAAPAGARVGAKSLRARERARERPAAGPAPRSLRGACEEEDRAARPG